MWKQLILFWAFFCSLCSWKVCAGFDWVALPYGLTPDYSDCVGLYSSSLETYEGFLWVAHYDSSEKGLKVDSHGYTVGGIHVGGLIYCVAYAIPLTDTIAQKNDIRLFYDEQYGFCLFDYTEKKVAFPTRSDFQSFDCLALYTSTEKANGIVPLNPAGKTNIFDYSYSMPRTDARVGYQSSDYRTFFKELDVKGLQTGATVRPDVIDYPETSFPSNWRKNARIFTTSDWSSFIVEQLRRLSDSYDSDGGGLADQSEWDASDHSRLSYYWDDPEDDVQYLPGVQQVELIGGGSVSLDPPTFDGAPPFEFSDEFGLGPESSDWSQKVLDSASALRDKLEPLRGRFLPLFSDLQDVDPVHRVQFDSVNQIGFVSSIPIDFSFDFSGASLGSSVASALSLMRSVLVVLIYAVLIWIVFSDVTKKGQKDD